MGDLVGLFEVVSCSVCAGAVKFLLSASSAEDEANLVDELRLGAQFVLVVEVLREAERALGARNDGKLQQGIRAFQEPRDHSVAGFMYRDHLLFLSAHDSSLLDAADQPLSCHFEVVRVDDQLVVPRCQQRSLVAEISDVSAAEARSQRGQALRIHVFGLGLLEADLAEVDVEDLPSALEVGEIDFHYPVESARPDERRVQQVLPVGRSHHNHVAVSAKSIHLHQDLVESVVPFVMGAVAAASLSAHCVDLVDEDYRGRFLSRCCE